MLHKPSQEGTGEQSSVNGKWLRNPFLTFLTSVDEDVLNQRSLSEIQSFVSNLAETASLYDIMNLQGAQERESPFCH